MNPRFVLVGSALAGGTLLALMESAAKAGLLLALAAAVVLGMRRSSAASRHLVWFCALAGALLLPLGFKLLPQWRVLPPWMRLEEMPRLFSPAAATSESSLARTLTTNGIITGDAEGGIVKPVRYYPALKPKAQAPVTRPTRLPAAWFLSAWGLAASMMLLPMFASMITVRRIASRAKKVASGPLMESVARVKTELGMQRGVTLLLGEPDAMPMVWGVFRCHLLLPSTAPEWSPQRLRAVLLHEISHLRRHDPLALWVAHLALAVHWFNPLAWLAVRQLRIEQESACDDCVLRHGVRSSDYAGEMLAITTSLQGRGVRFAALTMSRPSAFEARIAGILDGGKNRRGLPRQLVLGVSLIAMLAALPLAMLRAGDSARPHRGRLLDRNGVVLAESSSDDVRIYPFKALAAHTLGYVSKQKDNGAWKGLGGVERINDGALSQGRDVNLTLDARIQSVVENVLRDAGVSRGAAVILDCNNGDLLASASLPSYDPNDFIPGISKEKFKVLSRDKSMPLLNRSISATTPGSTFKLVTALAACRAGKSGEVLECNGKIELGNTRVGCWIWNRDKGAHGKLDLHDGITQSCNCYFIQLADKIGIEAITGSGRLLGLGELSGSGLPGENSGVLAGPESLKKRDPDQQWSPHMTAMTAIGQGESMDTPLQLAVIAAAIGNGEKVWVPRLNKNAAPQFRTDLTANGWTAQDLAIVRSALRDNVMLDGQTGTAARSDKIEIAGLTGTAQTARNGQRDTTAWFVGFAPANQPAYAIAVMVEGGESGGKVCGPIVRRIFETITMDLPEPTPVDPPQAPESGPR